MTKHLKQLRAYYRDRRRRRRARMKVACPPWDEDVLMAWAALWRIPPFDTVYPVRKRGDPCACGATALSRKGGHFTATTFPEGHLSACAHCGEKWLVLNDGP